MKKVYTYVTLKGADGNYIATVPELPGVVAEASSDEELSTRIKEAINAYLQTLEKEKLDVPQNFHLMGVNQVEINYD